MGRLLVPTQDLKINRQGNITIPTLISSAGNSENYVFSSTEDIYFEAEVYLNSYNTIAGILGALSTTSNIVNEYAFIISDINEVGGRGIPQGAVGVYNGERGQSLSCYYTDGGIVDLNQWTKIVAKRVDGNWSISINNIECSIARVTDAGVPNDQFGNSSLPIYIGRLEADNVNFDGQIRNVILSNEPKKNNRISIKKENLNKLKAYNTNPDAIYVFKSATTNLLGTIFNASQFISGNDTVQIFYQGSLSGPSNVFLANSSEWLDIITEETADNYVIPINSIILFSSVNANLNITIGGGAVIQKLYNGKLNLN